MIRLLLILWGFCLTPALHDSLPRGVVIDTVHVTGKPYSFSLYLPSDYSPSRQWPVIFALDPAKRGYMPVTIFKNAAEKYGYIIAGSNDSHNGQISKMLPAIWGMIRDVMGRFNIDQKRIYVAGFSGGARMASYLAFNNPQITGVIACGAGLTSNLRLSPELKFSFVTTVGDTDMNYLELNELHQALDHYHIPNHQIIFNGGHQWPDSLSALQAVQWLQLDAMRRNLIPTNPGFISTYKEEQFRLAKAEQDNGNLYRAHHILSGLQKDLTSFSFIDEQPLNKKILSLEKNSGYKKQKDKAEKLERFEMQQTMEYEKALHKIMSVRYDQIQNLKSLRWWKDRVAEINRLKHSRDTDKHHLGVRLAMFLSANVAADHRMLEKYWKDYTRMVWLDDVGMILHPQSPAFRYLLARSYILDHQYDNGLKTLEKAIELGYHNYKNLQTNTDFKSVRNRPKFQKLIKKAENQSFK